jgi:undecaprenyl-diphosphatase
MKRTDRWEQWIQAWWGRPGWDRFVHVTAAVGFVVAVWGFVELADDAPEGDYLEVEGKVMHAVRRTGENWGGAHTTEVMRDLTALGGVAVIVLLTLLILGYLLMTRQRRLALLVAIATAGGQGLNMILKNSFDRARPEVTLHLVEVTSTSFPSGHSMASSIFYLTLGALGTRLAARPREKAYLIVAALGMTFLIGLSRVYLGVHYPTDVLAGWTAGTAWALVCWFTTDWLGRRGKLRAEASPA